MNALWTVIIEQLRFLSCWSFQAVPESLLQ